MTEYTPESAFGWLAVDEEAAEETRRLVSAFDDAGTLDSLGIGAVRDAIANQLFPGTSTLQTRARYFLFIPWLCQQLENTRTPSNTFAERLRGREAALINSLKKGNPPGTQGIIGVNSGANTRQLPSTVYWSGLGAWGIRLRDVSLREYGRTLDEYYRHLARITREDEADDPDRTRGTWTRLPPIPSGFPFDPFDFQITPEESRFLETKIALAHHGSLLDRLVQRREPLLAPWPWQTDGTDVSPELREILHHAEMFSQVIVGAQYLYCFYLAADAHRLLHRPTEALAMQMEEAHADWWAGVSDDWGRVEEWIDQSRDFWDVVTRLGARVHAVRRFVDPWLRLVKSGVTADRSDPELRTLIERREATLKKHLARLSNMRALENWTGNEIGTNRLDYRWGNAKRIITDIVGAP